MLLVRPLAGQEDARRLNCYQQGFRPLSSGAKRSYNKKQPLSLTKNAGTRAVIIQNSCGATRLDVNTSTHCILTYAPFGNEVYSPSLLLACIKVCLRSVFRLPSEVHSLHVSLLRSHLPQLSVRFTMKLLTLLQRFKILYHVTGQMSTFFD